MPRKIASLHTFFTTSVIPAALFPHYPISAFFLTSHMVFYALVVPPSLPTCPQHAPCGFESVCARVHVCVYLCIYPGWTSHLSIQLGFEIRCQLKKQSLKYLRNHCVGRPLVQMGRLRLGEGETLPQGHAGRLMLGCVPVPALPAFGGPRVPVSCPQGLCHSHLVDWR